MKLSILFLLASLLLLTNCSTENTPIYTLSTNVNPSEAGSVNPSSGEYDEGTEVELTATPNEHWVFNGWQGDHSGNQNPASIVMDSDKSITAQFIKREYPLTINVEGEGSVQEEVIQQKTTDYPHGTIVQLTANPAEGWEFIEWSGDVEGTEKVVEIEVDEEKSITALFQPIDFLLTIEVDGNGQVEKEIVQSKNTEYPFGTNVELTAIPDDGWEFVEWSGDLEGDENPQTITINEEKSITAVFEIQSFSITVQVEGEGNVTLNPDKEEYEYGEEIDATAEAEEGWIFSHWEGDITDDENPINIIVDNNKNITAVFEEKLTELKEIISTNTTLGLSERPYQLTGKVQIAYGTTLEIEEGVKIYGENNVIEVFGNLLILGSNSSKVKLDHVHIQPGNNSIDELYHIEIHHAKMIGGELYSPGGGSTYGSITLKNSFLYEVNRSGFTETFMYIWYPQKDSYVEENIFYNAGRISIGHSDADVYVRNNLFFRDQELSNEIGYAIENWASYHNSKTVLKNNTFANTQGIAVSLPSGYDSASLDATDNYWNTVASDVIEDMIFDKNDDLSVNEEIPFEPFLNEADSNTPVLPDSLK